MFGMSKRLRKLRTENHALLHAVADARRQLKSLSSAETKKLYSDLHDPDRRAFWKSVVDGIDADAARKWAFERLNRRLVDIVNISPENSQAFYINQGAIAEINNFLNIHKLATGYLRDDMPDAEPEEPETESIAEEFS